MARATLTRAVEFSAGHIYRRPEWSDEENEARFGRCARRPGHGHNYRCEITVAGEVDPVTGMVMDLADLDEILTERIREPLDHAFLNDEPDFTGDRRIPTTENIARVIWLRLAPDLPDDTVLVKVRVREDRDLWAEYEGS